jgi:hypothetical protein
VASLALPVFDVIDRMYQYLIVTRLLEAYLVTPPLFYQDRVWGSNWLRNTEVWGPLRSHSPLSPPCGGAVSAATFMQSELGQVGLALSQARLECLAPFLAATASERARAHEQWSRHENSSRHEHASPLAPHLGGARKGGCGGMSLLFPRRQRLRFTTQPCMSRFNSRSGAWGGLRW